MEKTSDLVRRSKNSDRDRPRRTDRLMGACGSHTSDVAGRGVLLSECYFFVLRSWPKDESLFYAAALFSFILRFWRTSHDQICAGFCLCDGFRRRLDGTVHDGAHPGAALRNVDTGSKDCK